MAKTLFIVDDEVYQGLPEAARGNLLSRVRGLFSFIPLNVEARKPRLFPEVLHFTDSVVSLTESDQAVDPVLQHIKQKETANVQFSIKQAGVNLTINNPPPSFAGNLDRGGVGGHWKTVVPIGQQTVSISMTYGVASLETAEEAVVDEDLHGRSLVDIRRERQKLIDKKGLEYAYAKHQSLILTREEMEAELLAKHAPLKDWPGYLADNVVTALARIIAHEARHQYILAHSAAGLGADSPRVWGDPNYADFDGTDKANIVTRINDLTTSWNTAAVHLETCPQEKASPFD